MRYCRFQSAFGPQYGEIRRRGDQNWVERLLPPPEEDHLTVFPDLEAVTAFEAVLLENTALLAPATPSKIICVGRNYSDHAAELGNGVPKEPLLFLKPPSAIIGPLDPITLPPQSQRVDFEGELVLVIGKRACRIGPDEDVKPYIRGYTLANDVTARDLQKTDGQWSRAKGFDTFCPVGPMITDEIDPNEGVIIETRLNGALRQRGSTLDLIFPIAHLLRYISAAMTLLPGDIVLTGTPAGVAALHPGDLVEVLVEQIGTLSNPVRSLS